MVARLFEFLEGNEEEMTDQNLAAGLITAGRREINNGQLENLQNLCMRLANLLPFLNNPYQTIRQN
jgi:hypothetical protein